MDPPDRSRAAVELVSVCGGSTPRIADAPPVSLANGFPVGDTKMSLTSGC